MLFPLFFFIKNDEVLLKESSYNNVSLTDTLNEENLVKIIKYYKLSNADIILAQARLETGNFSSRICREYNNLFGLFNSEKGDYYRFTSWQESVFFYKIKIQSRYTGGDYYKFLSDIGYAEDTSYVNKLKEII